MQGWVQGPDLNQGRLYHAAGTITDSITQETIIVVTGGQKDGGPEGTLNSVELLLPFDYGYWIEGTKLEIEMIESALFGRTS